MPTRSCVLLLLAAACAAGQTLAKDPPGTALALRVQGRVHEGEPIPFQVDAPPRAATSFYQFEGFLLDPAAGCGTLQRLCYDRNPGGLLDPASPYLGGDVNRFLPGGLPAGRYRLAAVFTLEVLRSESPLGRTFGYTEPRQHLVSQTAELEILPATPEWQRRTVADAVKTLVEGDSYEPVQMRQAAAHTLRYLQTPLAWQAELDHLDKSEPELLAALEGARDRKAVCAMMRSRITEPRQFVSFGYLQTLEHICGTPSDEAAAALAERLPQKLPAVRGAALDALVQWAGASASQPSWLPAVRAAVVGEWRQMALPSQKLCLEDRQWAILRGADFAPLLIATLSRTEARDPDLWNAAVRRLFELSPERAQSQIVTALLGARIALQDSTLALLSPETTRGLTPRLLDAIARGGSFHFLAAMLARYGDAASLPRIRALFEAQADPCQPELLAYFLRVDPSYADAILHRQPWDMQEPAPACALRYFAVTARLHMSPQIEQFMTAYLMHRDVQIKMRAAESLGRYGTAAAEAPLWNAFEYFHNYWKDRPAQLNVEGEYLEVALRNAIARASAWHTSEAGLRRMASLCISRRCQAETAVDLQKLATPIQ